MAAVDVLRAAGRWLAEPLRWSKLSAAKTARGLAVRVNSPGAVRWCAVGALAKCGLDLHAGYDEIDEAQRLLVAALPYGYRSAAAFNDAEWVTHEVLAAWFSRAVRLAEREGVAA
jgi:hypothetical protein